MVLYVAFNAGFDLEFLLLKMMCCLRFLLRLVGF